MSKIILSSLMGAALLIPGVAAESSAAPASMSFKASSCAALTGMPIANGKITAAEPVTKGSSVVTEDGKPGLPAQVNFCRVRATLTPTPRSNIRVEVWLPEATAWNGKMLGAGNGGYGGSLMLSSLTMHGSVAKGYASAGTDLGHVGTGDTDAKWALNEPNRITDFGHRANHLTAGFAKAVIAAYYQGALKAAYFQGCSDGGREALMEAQRYPDDYDAIIAGAPANAWTRLMTSFMANDRAVFSKPESAIPTAKLKLLQDASVAKCDAADGVKDGVIDDPRKCGFDPAVLQCRGGDTAECLTAPQVAAAKALYQPTRDGAGKSFFPGYMPGAEAFPGAWDVWLTGPKAQHGTFSSEFFRYMVYSNANWQPTQFNLVRDYAAAKSRMAPVLDSDNPDITPFLKRGGKLILYHGWNDAAIAPENTIQYYQSVLRATPGAADSVRLFMVPGMSHCLGGPGATIFDPLTALDQWRQKGTAPQSIVATKYDNDLLAYLGLPAKPVRTRPLCPFPKVARWDGKGSTDDAANFSCVAPKT